jgi:hypothetical protein
MILTVRMASVVLLLFFWPIASAIGAAERSTDSAVEAVLSMLEAGLSEEVILAWLDSGDEAVPRPRAEQLIELQKAGASDALLKRLLSTDDSQPEGTGGLTSTSLGRTDSTPAVVLEQKSDLELDASAKLPSKSVPRLKTSAPKETTDREILVNFKLSYTPWYLNDRSFDPTENYWDFFVYLDGIPLSYVPPSSISGISSVLEFSRLVAPGRHIVRVTLERHKQSRGDTWSHEARAAEEAFEIELSPEGPQADVSVRFKETWSGVGKGGPLDFSFHQGAEVVELGNVGGNPEAWPPICEEIEANLQSRSSSERQDPGDRESCVSWDAIWDGTSAPPRSEVREALAMFKYRPVPKGS